MKKIFVLIISILLPIIAGAAVAAYGYNVRYVPETNSAIAGEFVRDMNKGIITSEERIANYRKLENYYYEEEPIFKKDILNNEGVTSAVKELITKVESLEKVVLSEQETFIKLINEVFKNE